MIEVERHIHCSQHTQKMRHVQCFQGIYEQHNQVDAQHGIHTMHTLSEYGSCVRVTKGGAIYNTSCTVSVCLLPEGKFVAKHMSLVRN